MNEGVSQNFFSLIRDFLDHWLTLCYKLGNWGTERLYDLFKNETESLKNCYNSLQNWGIYEEHSGQLSRIRQKNKWKQISLKI